MSHGNNSISYFVRMPQCIKKGKDDYDHMQRQLNNQRIKRIKFFDFFWFFEFWFQQQPLMDFENGVIFKIYKS